MNITIDIINKGGFFVARFVDQLNPYLTADGGASLAIREDWENFDGPSPLKAVPTV